MKITCPRSSCQNQVYFQKDGHFFRKSDSKYIQRYRCRLCGKRTSTAQLSACYGQKKRTLNKMVESLLCSKVSQRRIAKILNIDKKTVHRKVIFLGIIASGKNQKFRDSLTSNKVHSIQIDDMITKERTKLKPVTISSAVDPKTRKILALEAAAIPAFGHLSKISIEKYGKRRSQQNKSLTNLFEKLLPITSETAIIRSDEHKYYPIYIKKYLPRSKHQQFKSLKAKTAGQGELKKSASDPLYSINHTFGMMRDNLGTLVRQSWCVPQKIEMIQHRLEIYINFHNSNLV
ncbi:hypothetical protein N9N67_04975 [Bacteriovoracaceae bacterium]|nr:hypothetical protein [Bacteriovoracaceae bacterium]